MRLTRFDRPNGTLPPLAGHDPVLDRAPEGLRAKLRKCEDDLASLREQRAVAVRDADQKKAAFAASRGYDVNSAEGRAATAAVAKVRELDSQIAESQEAQVGLLRLIGAGPSGDDTA